jgi:hypothetical protein
MQPDIRKRLILSVAVATLLYAVFGAGAHTSLSRGEAEALSKQLESLTSQLDSPLDIFLNNFGISLIMAIPFAGPLFAGWVAYETGRYVAALATLQSISVLFLLAIPIILVYGLLEFIGYGGMVMGGSIFAYKILKRRARDEVKWYLLTILTSALVILVAALIEYAIITAFKDLLQEVGQYI